MPDENETHPSLFSYSFVIPLRTLLSSSHNMQSVFCVELLWNSTIYADLKHLILLEVYCHLEMFFLRHLRIYFLNLIWPLLPLSSVPLYLLNIAYRSFFTERPSLAHQPSTQNIQWLCFPLRIKHKLLVTSIQDFPQSGSSVISYKSAQCYSPLGPTVYHLDSWFWAFFRIVHPPPYNPWTTSLLCYFMKYTQNLRFSLSPAKHFLLFSLFFMKSTPFP